MGDLHRFQPRADAPARPRLTKAESWAVMAVALRASSHLAEQAAAAIEAGGSPAECFADIARLDAQNMVAGRIAACGNAAVLIVSA